jgi:hypothetical protein
MTTKATEPEYYAGFGGIYDFGKLTLVPETALIVKESDNTYTFRWAIDYKSIETPFDKMQLSEKDDCGKQIFSGDVLYTLQSPVAYYRIYLESDQSYIKGDSLYFKLHVGRILIANPEEEYYSGDVIFKGKLIEKSTLPEITWKQEETATGYRIDIYDVTGSIIVSLNFDVNGNSIGIAQKSLSLKTTEPFSFDANALGLKENETFYYTITALTEDGETQIKEGVFKTGEKTEPVSIETTSVPTVPVAYYNLLGQKLSEEPQRGMYIVQYSNGSTEKRVR